MLKRKANPILRRPMLLTALGTLVTCGYVQADDAWYGGVTLGLTNNGVSSVELDTGIVNGPASIDTDLGYTAGLVLGREFGGRWRVEGEFRYRTNQLDSVDLPGGGRITDGDYSSGALGVNGYYLFGDVGAKWRPFLGAGIAWMEEIDMDLEDDPINESYSGDGTAWQLMGGMSWNVSSRWSIDFEARYLDAGSISMDAENDASTGRIKADYNLFEVTAEATYRF
jgi:outer membrane autotransporter protein